MSHQLITITGGFQRRIGVSIVPALCGLCTSIGSRGKDLPEPGTKQRMLVQAVVLVHQHRISSSLTMHPFPLCPSVNTFRCHGASFLPLGDLAASGASRSQVFGFVSLRACFSVATRHLYSLHIARGSHRTSSCGGNCLSPKLQFRSQLQFRRRLPLQFWLLA